MAKTSQIVETQQDNQVEILKESLNAANATVEKLGWEHERLLEKLSGLDLQLDNVGWSESYGYDDEGPTLAQVKAISKQARNLAARNVHVKQGWNLRSNYVNAGGLHYDKIPGKDATGSGRRAPAWGRVNDPQNQRVFFGPAARHECEGALYCDGIVLYVGDDTTYRLSSLPLNQVSADYRNPDDPSEIWAYRRSWIEIGPNGMPTGNERAEWIYLNAHIDKRRSTITYLGKDEPVAQRKRLFGGSVNTLPGWAYGVPDVFSGMAWARQYRDVLLNGKTMTDALASVAFKMVNKSRVGAAAAGTKVAGTQQAGNVANILEGQDFAAMNTAGKGYDFDTARPLLAAFATGIGVSVVAVSSDPGAAGSSYGSAATLDLPTRLMAEARRQFHIPLIKEVLGWLGAPDADVWYEPIQDWSEILRAMQALIAKWNSGLFQPEDIARDIEELFGRFDIDVPDGVLIPNNEFSLARKDIDTDHHSVTPGAGAAPGQGQSTGLGDTGTNNDLRDDTIS